MQLDVRLAVVGAFVILAICLAVGFTRIAIGIRRDHQARFRGIRQRLEDDAMAVLNNLFRPDA